MLTVFRNGSKYVCSVYMCVSEPNPIKASDVLKQIALNYRSFQIFQSFFKEIITNNNLL